MLLVCVSARARVCVCARACDRYLGKEALLDPEARYELRDTGQTHIHASTHARTRARTHTTYTHHTHTTMTLRRSLTIYLSRALSFFRSLALSFNFATPIYYLPILFVLSLLHNSLITQNQPFPPFSHARAHSHRVSPLSHRHIAQGLHRGADATHSCASSRFCPPLPLPLPFIPPNSSSSPRAHARTHARTHRWGSGSGRV